MKKEALDRNHVITELIHLLVHQLKMFNVPVTKKMDAIQLYFSCFNRQTIIFQFLSNAIVYPKPQQRLQLTRCSYPSDEWQMVLGVRNKGSGLNLLNSESNYSIYISCTYGSWGYAPRTLSQNTRTILEAENKLTTCPVREVALKFMLKGIDND